MQQPFLSCSFTIKPMVISLMGTNPIWLALVWEHTQQTSLTKCSKLNNCPGHQKQHQDAFINSVCFQLVTKPTINSWLLQCKHFGNISLTNLSPLTTYACWFFLCVYAWLLPYVVPWMNSVSRNQYIIP